MPKLCIVYNMCGVRGNESSFYYDIAIKSILEQTFKDYILVLSGCKLSAQTKMNLHREVGVDLKVDYNYIDELYPVPVTFNHSCLQATEKHGPFDGYLYLDSGCIFQKLDDLQKLYDGFKSHDACGMYAAQVDEDPGYHDWFGLGRNENDRSEDYKLFEKGDFIVPVGKTCNLHAQIFSRELVEFYGKPYPDIFAGHCSESVFTFVCAALKLNMIISKDVVLHHERLDGQSAGFNPWAWQAEGRSRAEHPYLVPSIIQLVASPEAKEFGLGYEEVQGLAMHDPTQFTSDGYCKNSDLKHYIRNHLFVPKSLLDYDEIKSAYI